MPSSPTGYVRALEKAMAIIELLAGEGRGLPLHEIAKRLGFNASTAHHLLATLRARGFVDQDPETKAYGFGYKLVGLVNQFLLDADLYTAGIGPIKELRNASGDTSYLHILQGTELIPVIEMPGLRPIQVRRTRQPGETFLHSTASGKVLLAHLPPEQAATVVPALALTRFTPNTVSTVDALLAELEAIRQQGYALDREEYLEGLACVDAPVFGRDGTCVATASVAYPALDPERWRGLVPLVMAAAARISAALGYVPAVVFKPSGRAVA